MIEANVQAAHRSQALSCQGQPPPTKAPGASSTPSKLNVGRKIASDLPRFFSDPCSPSRLNTLMMICWGNTFSI